MGIGQERYNDYAGFECPACRHRRYYRLLVQRARRPAYRIISHGWIPEEAGTLGVIANVAG